MNNSIEVFWKGRRKRSPSFFAPPNHTATTPRARFSGARAQNFCAALFI